MGIQTYLECFFKDMEPAKSSTVFSLQHLSWYARSNLPLANHSSSTSPNYPSTSTNHPSTSTNYPSASTNYPSPPTNYSTCPKPY